MAHAGPVLNINAQIAALLTEFSTDPDADKKSYIDKLTSLLDQTNKLNLIEKRGMIINDACIQLLANVLAHNRTLTELELDSKSMGPPGSAILAQAFRVNRTLTKLSINQNHVFKNAAFSNNLYAQEVEKPIGIGDGGAQLFADALMHNQILTSLELSKNDIGPKGAKALAQMLKTNSTLTKVILDDNKLGDDGAQEFAQAMPHFRGLVHLSLGLNDIYDAGGQAIAHAIKYNRTLTYLNISCNRMGNATAQMFGKALLHNGHLKKFWIDNGTITPDELRKVKKVFADPTRSNKAPIESYLVGYALGRVKHLPLPVAQHIQTFLSDNPLLQADVVIGHWQGQGVEVDKPRPKAVIDALTLLFGEEINGKIGLKKH